MTYQRDSRVIASSVELDEFRFDWDSLPAISEGIPGTWGLTRVCLEDFVVSEIPRIPPEGEGEYAYAYVEKRGLNTHDLVAALRERGVPYDAVGVAGLKDKHAVTRQWLSVPVSQADRLEALDELEGVRVLETSRHSRASRYRSILNSFARPFRPWDRSIRNRPSRTLPPVRALVSIEAGGPAEDEKIGPPGAGVS